MHKKLTFDVLVNGKSQTSKPTTAELELATTEIVKVVLEDLQARLALTDSNVEITFSEEEIVE